MNRRIAVVAVFAALGLSSAALAAETPATPPEGSAVEVREGDEWSKATFIRKEGRRLLIRYSDNNIEEWITADRMRKSSGAAPTPAPAVGTAAKDAATVAPAGGEPVTLEGPFIEVSLDTTIPPRRGSPLAAKQTPATRPANGFSRLTFGGANVSPIDKLLPLAESGNILLGVTRKPFADQTQIVRLDLDNPDKAEERVLVASKQEVVGAAEGGKLLLTVPQDHGRVTVHLWEYVGEEYKLKANYTFISKKGGKRVEAAFMVSPSRVLVSSDGNENFLVDLTSRRAVCMFKTFGRNPELDPTGRMLMLYNNNSGGILKASDCSIVAELPECEAFQVPSLDPTGTLAAYPQGGGIRIAKVASGAAVATLTGVKRDRVCLLSAEHALVGDVLYDIKTGVPLWRYSPPQGSITQMLPNGQVLYVLRGSGAACVVNIPDAKAIETFKAQRPDDYLLAPGAQIVIAGGLNLYGAEETKAQELVRKSIASAGHKVASGVSAYKLTFASAAGKTEEQSYMEHGYMGPPMSRKVTVPSTIVTATLTRDGQTIWEQTWRHGAGGVLMRRGNQTMEQAAAEAAKPNVGVLNSMAIPAYIPKGSKPGQTATLGASTITPEGFVPAQREDKPDEKSPDGNRKPADEKSV